MLDGEFGLLPVEIKYGQSVSMRELRPLRDFVREHGCLLGLVITNDEAPRRYTESIVGVPFNCL